MSEPKNSSDCGTNIIGLLVVGCALALAAGVHVPAHAAGTAAHDAHHHGHGRLNAAVDGNDLLIELEVPAAHAVGFEHAPNNADQERLVDEALERIVTLSNWLSVLPSGACKLNTHEVELLGEHRKSGESHDHGAHTAAHVDDEHNDLHAQFHLTCKADMPAQALELTIGKVLTGIEELDATVLSPQIQRSVEVGATKTTLPLR